MTRETKIGLLVGLAFIIVIGILLSDHMTSSTDPPKAPLSVVGNNVRESVATPAAPGVAAAPAPAAVASGQGAVAPNQTVPTGSELSQPPRVAPPTVVIGPGAAPAQAPVVVQQGPLLQPQQIQVPNTGGAALATGSPVVIAMPQQASQPQQPKASHPLQQLANQHGEEIVSVGENGSSAQPPAVGGAPRQQPVPMAPLREYKAQAGDSLSKLAGRFMGANTKANRDAIVRVNPTLQQNPDKIVEGRTYVLPPMPVAETASATANPTTPTPAPAPVRNAPKETPAAKPVEPVATVAENFSWYTVKENENLWKIAAEQLGSGNAWTQIRDLNQDILKGEDQVRVNTKIRLPNRPVASAAH